jgi:hypothetical protein
LIHHHVHDLFSKGPPVDGWWADDEGIEKDDDCLRCCSFP